MGFLDPQGSCFNLLLPFDLAVLCDQVQGWGSYMTFTSMRTEMNERNDYVCMSVRETPTTTLASLIRRNLQADELARQGEVIAAKPNDL